MNPPSVVCGIVDELVVGLLNSQLYGAQHPRVATSASEAARRAATYCLERRQESLLVGVVGDHVVFEGRPVLGASLAARRLIRKIRDRGAGGIEFDANVKSEDVACVLGLLARRVDTGADLAAANAELGAAHATTLRLVPPYAASGGQAAQEGVTLSAAPTAFVALHQGTVDLLQGLTLSVCQGKDMHLESVRPDRKSTRLNSSHSDRSRMPSSA